ncbi:hypothetical protein O3P69_007960 [Scylla paramamosain]|uniref:Uncharacterized protein n=1 Tax=Scylla paramamosain TaxID=85552 RepID=A0AAW0SZ07_SCYPA
MYQERSMVPPQEGERLVVRQRALHRGAQADRGASPRMLPVLPRPSLPLEPQRVFCSLEWGECGRRFTLPRPVLVMILLVPHECLARHPPAVSAAPSNTAQARCHAIVSLASPRRGCLHGRRTQHPGKAAKHTVGKETRGGDHLGFCVKDLHASFTTRRTGVDWRTFAAGSRRNNTCKFLCLCVNLSEEQTLPGETAHNSCASAGRDARPLFLVKLDSPIAMEYVRPSVTALFDNQMPILQKQVLIEIPAGCS